MERKGGVECCQCANFASSQIQWDKVDGKLITGNIGIGNIERSDTIKPYTKRCAAEKVLLRTFCPFTAQGLGGWCARNRRPAAMSPSGSLWLRLNCRKAQNGTFGVILQEECEI